MVIVYARPEDEFYHKHAAWSYTFPASGKVVQKDELQPLRLVMLLLPEQAAAARQASCAPFHSLCHSRTRGHAVLDSPHMCCAQGRAECRGGQSCAGDEACRGVRWLRTHTGIAKLASCAEIKHFKLGA